MPFGYTTYPKTKAEHLSGLVSALQDKETLVLLDTNILAYLYKLTEDARNEFYSWAERLISEGRLHIPAWVLSEYLAKFKMGRLNDYTAGSKEPDEIRKKLENLHRLASLFVDDTLLKKIGVKQNREQFLTDFDAAIKRLSQFTSIFKHQFDAETIHEEIAARLSSAVLSSNIAELCIRAGREGELRVSHRMPPGFKDEGKSENRYGDMIIWFEMLEFFKQNKGKFKRLIFLSNDEKPDWVYQPKFRMEVVGGERIAIPNGNKKDLPISLADPRLIAEFSAVAGSRDLTVLSLPIFIEALSQANPSQVSHLASAIQIALAEAPTTLLSSPQTEDSSELGRAVEAVLEINPHPNATAFVEQQAVLQINRGEVEAEVLKKAASTQSNSNAPTNSASTNIVSVEIAGEMAKALAYNYGADALRDSAYEVDENLSIDTIIRDLRSHNWYIQNPAIQRIKTIRHTEGLKAEAWFVLGRNIYQAACGNSQKAAEFIKNLDIELARHSIDAANHILSGMLFEVYFNGDGEFRKIPKASQINEVFALVAKPEFGETRTFIQQHLESHQEVIVLMPGDKSIIPLSIQLTRTLEEDNVVFRLNSVEFAGRQFLRNRTTNDFDYLGHFYSKWDAEKIRSRLSEKMVVPEQQIRLSVDPAEARNVSFEVPAEKTLEVD